ncbi:hypothetical protein ACYSUW_14260 [Pseudomonas frederiksbergensis]
MKLKTLRFPSLPFSRIQSSRGDIITIALMVIGGIGIIALMSGKPSQSDRIRTLEQRLDTVESQLQTERVANNLSRLSGVAKRSACDTAVRAFAADNKLVPESISRECVIPSAELNKDVTSQTSQEQADEFMAKVLPTMAALAPKAKKAACEMFLQSYQQEHLTTPPAMNAECGL